MQLKDFLEAANYRITEGSVYGWSCFGIHAYCLDVVREPDEFESAGATVIFDSKTREIFEVTVYDYHRDNFYRWFAPGYHELYRNEAKARSVIENEVFDNKKFCDLEVEEDILEKLTAIMNNEPYDERVLIPLNLDNSTLLRLFKMAHEQDITFNDLVINIVKEQIFELEK